MRRPADIPSDRINTWADQYDAPGVLPRLVRRLLWATAWIEEMEMPGEGTTRLGGWDGLVRARTSATPYGPMGVSGWELSTRADVLKKLTEDYDKRTGETSAQQRQQMTYVAVTARRMASSAKEKWLAERRATAAWKDVRCIDADNLSDWLSRALPVALWFRALLGDPVSDVLDVDAFLVAWSGRTAPSLPAALLLAGRRDAVGAVHRFLLEPVSRPLAIRADSREEATAFAAAAIVAVPEDVRERLQSRALVVETRDAWRWLSTQAHGTDAILLPRFEGAEREPLRVKAHVILPFDRSAPNRKDALDLPPLSTREVASILEKAGVDPQEARRAAEETRGRVSPIMRRFGDRALPAWADGLPREPLFAMLLAGQWAPAVAADREALSGFGVAAKDVEALCLALMERSEPPVVREGDVWQWISPQDAWAMLGRSLPESMLDRFAGVVRAVLGSRDPRFDLPKEERMFAALRVDVPPCSPALREGLARSLVWLSRNDEALRETYGRSLGSRTADRLVRELLPEDWRAWASLSDVLPWLAEAAPEELLRCAEESLRRGDEGVVRLLGEEESFGGPHTGLLWALETLAWRADLFPRVALVLSVLARHDLRLSDEGRGRKLLNGPFRSLRDMLWFIMPQSASDVSSRLGVLQHIFVKEPQIGWPLALSQLPQRRLMLPARRAKIAIFPDTIEDGVETSLEDRMAQIEGVVDMVLARARQDTEQAAANAPQQWSEILEHVGALPSQLQASVLDAVREVRAKLDDPGLRVWRAIRRTLHDHRKELRTNAADDLLSQRLLALLEMYEPHDPVEAAAWLFTFEVDILPEWYENVQDTASHIERLRAEALQRLWTEGQWALLERLVRARSEPSHVNLIGRTLAEVAFSDEIESALWAAPISDVLEKVLPAFFASRAKKLGPAWSEARLRSLAAQGRVDDVVRATLMTDATPRLWNLLEQIGEPIATLYWQKVVFLGATHPPEEQERAARKLLALGRAESAAEVAAAGRARLPTQLLFDVLEALRRDRDDREAPGNILLDQDIEQLLDALDVRADVDAEKVASMELSFAHVLARAGRLPRVFVSKLEQVPPSFFVRMVETIYRPAVRSGVPGSNENHRIAEGCHVLLEQWQGVPGSSLGPPEREALLEAWATLALDALTAGDRAHVGAIEVAKVLARAPASGDGVWPCLAARRLLETDRYPDLAAGLLIAKRNLRGPVRKPLGEGGAQEREIAQRFRRDAEQLRLQVPRTAALLDELAQIYEREAEDEDVEHAGHHQAPAAAPAPASPPEASPGPEPARPSPDNGATVVVVEPDDQLIAVEIEGFRSIERLSLDLGGLTVLIGANGSGKSTALEAFELLRRASQPAFLDAVNRIHGGPPAMLAAGARSMRLSLRIKAPNRAAPPLSYEVELTPTGSPPQLRLHRERLTLEGEPEPLLERLADSVRVYRTAPRSSLLDPSGTTLAAIGAFSPHPAFERLRRALAGVELHLPFEVTALWAAREHRRSSAIRAGVPFLRADRLERFGTNLANVYHMLTNSSDWSDTLEILRLGLGDDLQDVGTEGSLSGEIVLKVRLRDRDVLAAALPDGMLAYLAFVALHQLQRRDSRATLLAFDEPDLHLHPHLIPRVMDLLSGMAERTPVVLATQSDAMLNSLEDPERSVRVCELDPGRCTVLRRLSRGALATWLESYRGLGSLRAEGYLPLVIDESTDHTEAGP